MWEVRNLFVFDFKPRAGLNTVSETTESWTTDNSNRRGLYLFWKKLAEEIRRRQCMLKDFNIRCCIHVTACVALLEIFEIFETKKEDNKNKHF